MLASAFPVVAMGTQHRLSEGYQLFFLFFSFLVLPTKADSTFRTDVHSCSSRDLVPVRSLFFIFVCAMCEVSHTDSPVCVDDSRCMLEVGGEFRAVCVCMFMWGGGWGRSHEKTYMC